MPNAFRPFCANSLTTGVWIVPRPRLDIVPQTSPPHTALKAALREKAQGGKEGKGAAGGAGSQTPTAPQPRAWGDKGQLWATGIISWPHHPAPWGTLDPCPPMFRALLTDLSCCPRPLPHRRGLHLHENALFGRIIA